MRPSVKQTFFLFFLEVLCMGTVYMIPSAKLTNAVCESRNKSWAIIEECRLRAISRNKTVLNVNIKLIQPAHVVHLKFQMMRRLNGYKPWFNAYTFDLCANFKHPVLKVLWDLIKDYSSLYKPCPLEDRITLKDFFWDARNFTLPLPRGDYALMLTYQFDRKPQFVTNVYFSFSQGLFTD